MTPEPAPTAAVARYLAALAQFALRAAGGEVDRIGDEAVALIATTLGVPFCALWEASREGALELRASVGWRADQRDFWPVRPHLLPGAALLAREPVIVTDLSRDPRHLAAPLQACGFVSGACTPLPGNDRSPGVLAVFTTYWRRFQASELQFLQGMACVLAQSAERRRLLDVLRRYVHRVGAVQTLGREILAADSAEALARLALARLHRLTRCHRASIWLVDATDRDAVLLATQGPAAAGFAAGTRRPLAALRHFGDLRLDQPCIVHDLAAPDPACPAEAALSAEGVHVYTQVPLHVREQIIGFIEVGWHDPEAFTTEHVDQIREIALPLALALQQARLHAQVERHAAELEARVAERTAQLRASNAELESFSYSVSHDLRAPLRAMQGFANALLEDYADRLDAAGQDYARRIATAAGRMDTLIQELLAYSRLGRTRITLGPVSLAAVVETAVAQCEAELDRTQAHLEVVAPLPEVIGHRSTLVQVVLNLLTNALKFVAPGVMPRVRVWAEPRGERVRLWVEDNGIGIAPEHQGQIFRVFERLHGIESYPGTGIGLAIVRRGVERMGGRTGVLSALGAGSRFWVELPRAESQA